MIDIKQIKGQLGLFDEKSVNVENECLGEPCKYCDVEWCSLKCFERRGYMYDKIHGFARDSYGKCLRRGIEHRICKKGVIKDGLQEVKTGKSYRVREPKATSKDKSKAERQERDILPTPRR